jgi:hypothetical protein
MSSFFSKKMNGIRKTKEQQIIPIDDSNPTKTTSANGIIQNIDTTNISKNFIDNPNETIEIRNNILSEILKIGNNLLNSKCYSQSSCEALLDLIQIIKNDSLNYLKNIENVQSYRDVSELRYSLNSKQRELIKILKIKYLDKKGGKTKRKRKIYKKYRKTKKL